MATVERCARPALYGFHLAKSQFHPLPLDLRHQAPRLKTDVETTASNPDTRPVTRRERRPRAWHLFLLAWTVLAIAALTIIAQRSSSRADQITLADEDALADQRGPSEESEHTDPAPPDLDRKMTLFLLKRAGEAWLPWVFFAPYVAWLALRCPVERRTWRWSLPLHAATGIVLSFANQAISGAMRPHMVVMRRTEERIQPGAEPERRATVRVRRETPSALSWGGLIELRSNLPVYWVIIGFTEAWRYRARARERERRALELEASLLGARLQALNAQLHPHFLFNTLNAVSALIRRNPREAEEVVTSLSDLLRVALATARQPEITLREELESLEHYLHIQKIRFGERLTIRREIAPETLDCMVPALLLQPVVENAIRHGVELLATNGCIVLRSASRNGALILEVEDNGPGSATEKGTSGSGLGLASTRARLEALYGSQQRLELKRHPQGDTAVTIARIEIPTSHRQVEESGSVISQSDRATDES